MESYRLIPLHGKRAAGKSAKVSPEDYERLNDYRWFCDRLGYVMCFEAIGGGRKKQIYMHRMVLEPKAGYELDHIDRDKTNNMRENFRYCTRAENTRNQGPRVGSSKYKGVCWVKKSQKWISYIRVYGKRTYLGCFLIESDAALAYDKAARELFGEFAYLNFPEVV